MNDNNLIVLGIDLSTTQKNFDVQLQQICKNISNSQSAKIALSLDTQKTMANFQTQMNSLMQNLKTNSSGSFDGIADGASKAQKPLAGLQETLKQTGNIAKSAGGDFSGSFASSLANSTAKMMGMLAILKAIQLAINSVKAMIENVTELDKSLTELNKVQDFTAKGLKEFTDKAYNAAEAIGRTGKEIIEATTEFKKAGYALNESLQLAQSALIMTNIGDGINNVTEASSALISVLRGFNIKDSDALAIVDRINAVSNQSPISFDNITDGLRRVAGTLSQTGTSIDETIGLLTGGFAQLRNIEQVSNGLVFISQRLRGIGEDGEAIEGLAPKIAKEFKDIANIDIEKPNGELRSTYEILADMARVFPTLTDKQRQYLGELSSGNRQVKVLNSILQQWQDVDNAINQSNNSLGSATKENEVYRNSIAGVKKELESAFQDLSQTVINSEWIKAPLKSLTEFIKVLTQLADNKLVQALIQGTLIMSIPKMFNGIANIGSFVKDYSAIAKMIVSGNDAVTQSTAKVGKSFGRRCKKRFKLNTPTYREAA